MPPAPSTGQRSPIDLEVQDPGNEKPPLNVVVTAGGTLAPVDDVRFLSNVSSGRFASAITEAFLERGASVWHIQTPTAVSPFRRFAQFDLDSSNPATEHDRLVQLQETWKNCRDRLHLTVLPTGTVGEYQRALESILESEWIHIAILAMAVSDFEPETFAGKISSDAECLTIHCHRAPKVIQRVRDWSPEVFLVGFKLLSGAPHEELIRQAQSACRDNRADLTVANDLQTLRDGHHTVHLVSTGNATETLAPGSDLASRLVNRVVAASRQQRMARAADYINSLIHRNDQS